MTTSMTRAENAGCLRISRQRPWGSRLMVLGWTTNCSTDRSDPVPVAWPVAGDKGVAERWAVWIVSTHPASVPAIPAHNSA